MVAVDERMVKSKHWSGIRQYIKNKPTKWGIKLWVLADSANGYTYDFDVYIGKNVNGPASENGLGYDVVRKLVTPLVNQGYHIYFDNFYTSPKLITDLFHLGLPSCGTAAENRREFPDSMKRGKEWARRKDRGSMRWVREGNVLGLQWKDNRTVTMLTSIHSAQDFGFVDRQQKVEGRWRNVEIRQPKAINDYNKYMNAVDRAENPGNEALKRPKKYSIVEFREELVRQLCGLEDYGQPPAAKPPPREPGTFSTLHIPHFSQHKRQCKVCYDTAKTVLKVVSYCSAPQCQVYLHCTQNKNCFEIWHSNDYPHT
ncbi:PiggyBac transposable element-derived protein 4 [Exaiptasia diaphana]|nr:PiggyBac transposable element-derived protein 4 [Exaiptasia diaphana]